MTTTDAARDAALTHLEQAARYAAEVGVLTDLQSRLAAWFRLRPDPADRDAADLGLYVADFIDDRTSALQALEDQINAYRRQSA